MTIVTTAGNALILASDAIPDGIADALPLALLWGQAVIRSRGDVLGTDAYFSGLSTELGRIAWNVTDAGTTRFSVKENSTKPTQSVLAIAQSLVPANQLPDLAHLLSAIEQAVPQDRIGSFLTTWWDQRNAKAQGTIFAAAPAWINDNLQLETTLVQFDYAVSADSWQSFFVSRMSAGATVTARNVTLTLNDRLWAPCRPEIARKLGQSAIASIISLEL